MIIRHNVYPSYSISAAARAELCKELHAAQVQSQLRCQTEVSTVGSMLEGVSGLTHRYQGQKMAVGGLEPLVSAVCGGKL